MIDIGCSRRIYPVVAFGTGGSWSRYWLVHENSRVIRDTKSLSMAAVWSRTAIEEYWTGFDVRVGPSDPV
jgi:hypothetical protein